MGKTVAVSHYKVLEYIFRVEGSHGRVLPVDNCCFRRGIRLIYFRGKKEFYVIFISAGSKKSVLDEIAVPVLQHVLGELQLDFKKDGIFLYFNGFYGFYPGIKTDFR